MWFFWWKVFFIGKIVVENVFFDFNKVNIRRDYNIIYSFDSFRYINRCYSSDLRVEERGI